MILNYFYSKQQQDSPFTKGNAISTFAMQQRPDNVAHIMLQVSKIQDC